MQKLKKALDELRCMATVTEYMCENADDAPVIFLIDENHLHDTSVQENAKIASIIVEAMKAPAFIEHFPSGQEIEAKSESAAGCSKFHVHLLGRKPQAKIFGADCKVILRLLQERYGTFEEEYSDIEMAHCNDPNLKQKLEEYKSAYLDESSSLPCQYLRSRTFVKTALAYPSQFSIINAGAKHHDHIITNKDHDGLELIPNSKQISFIRIQANSYPRKGSD